MHLYELECRAKDWFAILKVKVTARAHDENVTVAAVYSELLIILQVNLV